MTRYKVGDVVKYYYLDDASFYKEIHNTYGIIIKNRFTLYYPSEDIEIYLWYSFMSMKTYEFGELVLFL